MLKASNKFFCFETHQKAILYGSLKVLHLFFFCKNKPGIKITMLTFGLPFISFFLSFYFKKKKQKTKHWTAICMVVNFLLTWTCLWGSNYPSRPRSKVRYAINAGVIFLQQFGFSRAKTSKGLETNTDCKAELGKLHSLSK